MPVAVPAYYVDRVKVDYDAEVRSMLGGALPVGSLEIKPPTLGTYSLLELMENQFFINPNGCNVSELLMALYIVNRGKNCIAECRKEHRQQMIARALDYIGDNADAVIANVGQIYRHIAELPFTGFDMMPGSGGGNNKPFIFDAEYLASVMTFVCMTSGNTPCHVLWQMPMTMTGHIYAGRAKYEGTKHVGRKDDPEALERVMKAAMARELRGELHPWQIDNPLSAFYQLSKEQVNARPAIIEEFEQLKQQALEKIRTNQNG